MSDSPDTTPPVDRASFIAGLEFAARLCERMEATSPRKPYQEAAAWLAQAIREKGAQHAQQF